jgi:UDP-glucose 4-epimerase
MRNFLITGGAGFIGSHLTESLLKDGEHVTVIDNFSTGSRANLAAAADDPKLRIIAGDVVTDLELLRREVRAADVVIHLAAAVGVELVVHDPVRTITTNVHGTENVLNPAAEFGKRAIVASTSEVYGKSTSELFSESDDLLIGNPEHSRWSYACSKLLDEFYLMALHHMNGLPGTVVRFFNTVGPRQTGRYGMVVPRFVERALRNEPIPVYGSGSQSRCFCHVLDVVRALKLVVDSDVTHGKVFNIGSQRSTTIEELARLVIERTGSKSKIQYISYEEAYEKGFEDMMRRVPDTAKIKSVLHWSPERSLESIIDDVAAFCRTK